MRSTSSGVVRFTSQIISQSCDSPAVALHHQPVDRTEILVTAGLALVSALLGYALRGAEFRRTERLQSYASAVAAFHTAVYAGVALLSLSMRYGEGMTQHPEASQLADDWTAAIRAYRDATSRVRIVGSQRATDALSRLESFFNANVLAGEPFTKSMSNDPTAGWGEYLRKGPRHVEDQSLLEARAFAKSVARDFRFFRR